MPKSKELSAREREVWDLVCGGLNTTAIAKRLFISEKTVETHRTHINKKLGTRSSRDVILQRIVELAGPDASGSSDEKIEAVLEVARRALEGSSRKPRVEQHA